MTKTKPACFYGSLPRKSYGFPQVVCGEDGVSLGSRVTGKRGRNPHKSIKNRCGNTRRHKQPGARCSQRRRQLKKFGEITRNPAKREGRERSRHEPAGHRRGRAPVCASGEKELHSGAGKGKIKPYRKNKNNPAVPGCCSQPRFLARSLVLLLREFFFIFWGVYFRTTKPL